MLNTVYLAGIFFGESVDSHGQTAAALAVVAVSLGWLLWHTFGKSKHSAGCGGGACNAVSKDVKKLQAHLKSHPPHNSR